ncbi:MAG: hypothetical protein JWM57_3386 [Phycisphaerales bacterium]|nr:hypothetical protein [Phycisphaerales bacterium]
MYWSQYRRTFVPIQAFILVACLLFVFVGHLSPRALVTPLLVMEAAAIFGARQAARMKKDLRGDQLLLQPLIED